MIYTLRTPSDRKHIINCIENLKQDKTWTVEIKQHRTRRTLSQNKLYWLWIACIAQETGNDKETIHNYFKEKYLPKRQVFIFSDLINVPASTTELDTKSFTQYLDQICADVATEGIILPNPGDVNFEHFYETYKNYIG